MAQPQARPQRPAAQPQQPAAQPAAQQEAYDPYDYSLMGERPYVGATTAKDRGWGEAAYGTFFRPALTDDGQVSGLVNDTGTEAVNSALQFGPAAYGAYAAGGSGLGALAPAYGAYAGVTAPIQWADIAANPELLDEYEQAYGKSGVPDQIYSGMMNPGYSSAALGREGVRTADEIGKIWSGDPNATDASQMSSAGGKDYANLVTGVEQIGKGTQVDMDRLQNIKMKELQNQPLSQGEMMEKQRLSEKIKADRQQLEELGTFGGALKHVLSNTAWNPMNWG
jgi:hypothetical protein